MLKLNQRSTKVGLGLLGGAVAIATGNPDLITVTVTDSGYEIGGVAHLAYSIVTGLAGFFLSVFDEEKNTKDA